MPNPFDQFDGDQDSPSSNPFDQFDSAQDLGFGDTALDIVGGFAEGFNTSLDTLINAPQRGVDAVYGLLTNQEIPDISTRNALSGFLRKDIPQRTKAGRVARTAGEVVALDAPLAAATLGAAPALAAATRGASKLGPQIVNRLAQSVANSPGRAALGELVASTGAGAGVGLAKENNLGPTGQALSGLAGAIAPTAAINTPTALATRLAVKVAKRFSPSAQRLAAADNAKQMLSSSIGDAEKANLAASSNLEENIPGLKLTVAEASESPTLLRAQDDIAKTTLSGDQAASELARREANQSAIDLAKDSQAPRRSETFGDIISSERMTTITQVDAIGSKLKDIDNINADLARRSRGDASSANTGKRIRDDIIGARTRTKKIMSKVADKLGINDPASRIDTTGLKAALRGAFLGASEVKSSNGRNFAGTSVSLDELQNGDVLQSFSAITQTRSGIGKELSAAIREGTNPSLIRGLGAMQSRLDEFIEALPSTIGDPDLAAKYKQFREIYKTKYIEPFEQGVAYKVLKKKHQRRVQSSGRASCAFIYSARQ